MSSIATDRPGTVVLGPERSGTSLVASIVGRLGAQIEGGGRRDEFNETGYWEDPELVSINEQILSRIGVRPAWAPSPPRIWTGLGRVTALEPRARAVVRRLESNPTWAVKDPRLSITIPFWKPLFSTRPRYIVCLRNPMAVAKSLRVKDGYTVTAGMKHWHNQMLHAIANTQGEARLFVSYESLVGPGGQEAADRISEFLGLPITVSWADLPVRTLDHSGDSCKDLNEIPEVTPEARHMYTLLSHALVSGAVLEATGSILQLSLVSETAVETQLRLQLGAAFNRLATPVFNSLHRRAGIFRGEL